MDSDYYRMIADIEYDRHFGDDDLPEYYDGT